jgi:hypothetical protein
MAPWDQLFDLILGTLPHGKRASKQIASLPGEFQNAASPIGWVWKYLHQATTIERLQRGSQGGSVHGEQRGYRRHRRRIWTIERHQE